MIDMEKRIDREQAKRMLKLRRLTMKSLAEYTGVGSQALTNRWSSGKLSVRDTLMLYGYLLLHDVDLQQFMMHRDDAVIQARLEQLKAEEED